METDLIHLRLREGTWAAVLVAALLIVRPDGKFLFVSKKSKYTIPTEHMEKDKGDMSLKDALRRCAEEELGITREEITIQRPLGSWISHKSIPDIDIMIEVFLCSVSSSVAKKIKFKERDEDQQVWMTILDAIDQLDLDGLASKAIRRLYKYSAREVSKELSGLLEDLNGLGRRKSWKEYLSKLEQIKKN